MDKDIIALHELLDSAINDVLQETTDRFKIHKDPSKHFYPGTSSPRDAFEFYTTNKTQEVHQVKDPTGDLSQSNAETTQISNPYQENKTVKEQPVDDKVVYHSQPPKEVYQGEETQHLARKNNIQSEENSQRFQENTLNQKPEKRKILYNSYTPSDFNEDNYDDNEIETPVNPTYRGVQRRHQPSETIQQDRKTEKKDNATTGSYQLVQDSENETDDQKRFVERKTEKRELEKRHPPLVSRAQWGALPTLDPVEPLEHPAKSIVFSLNTGTRPCTNQSDCQRIVREIQARHMGQGLADIQYSFLVGGDGNMYEGRGWDLKSGLQEDTYDDSCINIAFIGNYEDDPTAVPKSMLGPVQDMIIYGNSKRLIDGANMKHDYSK